MSKTILVIDDDEDDRDFFCRALGKIDKTIGCYTASNYFEAMQILDYMGHRLPDYIFLDLNMPRVNGRESLALFKADSRLKSIPVIIYSTSNWDRDIEDTRALGAAHFISKPVKEADLVKKVLFVLSQH